MRILAQGQIHDTQCVSPDGQWVVFDSRTAGMDISQSTTISKVHIETGEVVPLYSVECREDGPGIAAATFSPCGGYVLFIHGIRPYAFHSRFGMLVHADGSGPIGGLDRPPLRGGTHAHTWHPIGQWVSCTYNDALLPEFPRTVAVMTPSSAFVIATPEVSATPGSDEFEKAFDECWIGDQPRIAFQGNTRDENGELVVEVFVADLSAVLSPDTRYGGGQFTTASPCPLPLGSGGEGDEFLPSTWGGGGFEGALASEKTGAGKDTCPLQPPAGITIRRLTRSRGIQGVRHWLRATPDGSQIACLMLDPRGVSQIHLVDSETGTVRQLTQNDQPVDSPFNFSPDGTKITYSCGNRICITEIETGVTQQGEIGEKPINGVVWTPDGRQLITNRVIDGVQVITIESS